MKKNGFTLVEVMLVVAIIGILVTLAIPILTRMRLSANEAAAKASMRTIMTALEGYRMDQNPPTYPNNLVPLAGLLPPYMDPLLASGSKSGYNFSYNASPMQNTPIAGVNYPVVQAYSIGAMPVTPGTSGNKTYYSNSAGAIYQDATAPYDDPGMAAYTPNIPAGFN